jgi:hypothetical protein
VYLTKAFDSFAEENRRKFAKRLIEIIEPRKSSRFPYNGRERTKPGWWPDTLPHRSPDFIDIQGNNFVEIRADP